MEDSEKLKLCVGCREDYYNGKNERGIARCWMLDSAKPVVKYRIGIQTLPASPGAYTKVNTLSCHSGPKGFVHHEKLPNFVKLEDVIDQCHDLQNQQPGVQSVR